MEKKRQIAAVLILLALIGVIAYRHSTGKDLEKYEASFFDVFDTQTQIIGYASSKEQFSEQMSLIKDKFQYYNDLYDIYHDYEGMNNIKTINDNAGIQPVKVDEKIIELLKLGITMDEKTDGNMNIAMGSVLSIWHDYREIPIPQSCRRWMNWREQQNIQISMILSLMRKRLRFI